MKEIYVNEIIIRGQRYSLPEGFKAIEGRFGVSIYDNSGMTCSLYEGGFTSQVNDNRPYINTINQERILLGKVEE